MYWNRLRVGLVVLLGTTMLSACTGMSTGVISTAASASDRLLALLLNRVFPTELKPVEPGYAGFFQDLKSELEFNCKNGACRSAKFGWESKDALANFVVECSPVSNGRMGCEHYKQQFGDTKVYPAGKSAYEFKTGGFEMVAFTLRGDGKTDPVSLALGISELQPTSYVATIQTPEPPLVPVVPSQNAITPQIATTSPVIVSEKKLPVLASVPVAKVWKKPQAEVFVPGIIRADLRLPVVQKKKEIPKEKNTKIKKPKIIKKEPLKKGNKKAETLKKPPKAKRKPEPKHENLRVA